MPSIARFHPRTKRRLQATLPPVYEGALHAFHNDTRPSYNVSAARDAWARTLELFRAALP